MEAEAAADGSEGGAALEQPAGAGAAAEEAPAEGGDAAEAPQSDAHPAVAMIETFWDGMQYEEDWHAPLTEETRFEMQVIDDPWGRKGDPEKVRFPYFLWGPRAHRAACVPMRNFAEPAKKIFTQHAYRSPPAPRCNFSSASCAVVSDRGAGQEGSHESVLRLREG